MKDTPFSEKTKIGNMSEAELIRFHSHCGLYIRFLQYACWSYSKRLKKNQKQSVSRIPNGSKCLERLTMPSKRQWQCVSVFLLFLRPTSCLAERLDIGTSPHPKCLHIRRWTSAAKERSDLSGTGYHQQEVRIPLMVGVRRLPPLRRQVHWICC